jgi:hypothetical protein
MTKHEKIFHPGRKEHAEEFITHLEDQKSRDYATRYLEYIWTGTDVRRPRVRGLRAARVKEIHAALSAIFATIR